MSVDLETGEVKIDRLTLAHDCGRALNPVSVEGQIEGGAYMGAGEALMEEQGYRAWMHKKPSLLDYKIPTSLDTPPIQAIIIETIDTEGPYGAKEAGEGPLNPVVPAIANAVYDAIGVRIDETPITAEKILRALGKLPGRPRSIGSALTASRPRNPIRSRSSGPQATAAEPAGSGDRLTMLRLPRFELLSPATVRDAATMLRDAGTAMIVAGGTDLFPKMKRRRQLPEIVHFARTHPGAARGVLSWRQSAHRRDDHADRPR